MNEQRIQDYLNLIEMLLGSSSKQEILEILKANLNLIDEGLMAAIEQVAKQMAAQENQDAAKWLHNLAAQLIVSMRKQHQAYLNLIQMLVSCPNEQRLKVLQANQDLVDEGLVRAIEQVAISIAEENKPNAIGLQDLAERLAVELYQSSYYDQGIIFAELALRLDLLLLGEEHPHVATSLNNLASFYYEQGRYSEAEQLFKEALELRQKLLGEEHPHVATSLNNLAGVYRLQGRYSKAESLLKQVLSLDKHWLGEVHPEVAISLNNLAAIYYDQGRYSEAEPLFKQALELTQHLEKDVYQQVAFSLNHLAQVYRLQGRYSQAEGLLKQALELTQRLLGDQHPDLAFSMDILAGLYRDIGRYNESESLYEQTLALRRYVLGNEHLYVAMTLNNLAELYHDQERYSEAESLYKQTLIMKQQLLGDEHPNVATSMHNLAGFYYSQGRYSEAESLYKQTLIMKQRLLGDEHPDVAGSLNNMALLYYDLGRYSEAEPLLKQALEIRQHLLGDKHPDLGNSLENLATLLVAIHRQTEAITKLFQAIQIESNILSQAFAICSEADRLSYLQTIRGGLYILLSLILGYFHHSTEVVRTALDTVLRRKSLSAAALTAQNRALLDGRYPHLTSEFQQLRALSDQIIHLTFSLPKQDELHTYQKRLSRRQAQYDELQRRLASQVPETHLQEQLKTVECCAVALELSEGTVLVEFVRFLVFAFNAIPAHQEPRWQPARYLAFVLPAKQPDQVRMIDLGLAEDIDHLIQNFRESVIPGKQKNTGGLLDFGDWDDAPVLEIMKSNPAAAIRLREAIFEPIRPYLGEMKSLILAPDGALNLIPFQILPIDETGKQLLMDKYTISYLSVGRDILRAKVQPTRPASAPLVIADPDFDLAAEQCAESHTTNLPPTTLDILNTLGGDRRFERMSGTRLIGESLAKKLKGVRLYLEAEAVESHLATCQSPSILLIATHGIFFSDAQDKPPTQELTLSRLDLLSKGKIENPMMRSGLALAGANTWLADGSLPKEAGKGFVFAQDVAGLDLWANEITVLSACNTAMGDIKIGEGVFGLRRAFAVAGAKTLVMSLWPVPDKATALLMERFFDNCDRGLGRAEALQEAQNYLRTITVKELRQSSLGLEVLKDLLGVKELDSQVSISCQENDTPLEHPFYWGAWICQGDTTPLPFTACS
ncbi:CHAT domain-containing protein [Tychonema sp. LEGE 07203]|uniref:CHAT domain-containing tetratricopeptide repeat protein n=1 Tax=Tychonema sp. LEGE 07203 TaxID=1828671 RepID=UPI00187E6C84|nr:CHAT domain-containing protein [Tychonema sp. LEGE 07203]MBE9092407.1 CHAT domain-containing protein [Tychonema sp. LEGE 07203]